MEAMMRHCDGTDPYLLDGPTPNAGPCACGLRFDDAARSTVYPHVFIPTRDDKERLAAMLDSIAVEEAGPDAERWTAEDLAAIRSRARARAAEFAPFVS